jgi:hypothetical protein
MKCPTQNVILRFHTSYFLLRITMRCMVERQYDAACCGSTGALQFHTSYFLLHAFYFICVMIGSDKLV